MQYDFLNHFPRRMKSVGLHFMLIQNSIQKTTWKQYGFTSGAEQINIIYAVLLYIMEQSLREETCTMDDIGAYIDTVNVQYFRKSMNYDQCKQLGDFIVNVILSNEGRAMYFKGFDFQENDYQNMHISYVANRIVYVDQEFRRTSYYLTDDGYNLLLSTLEIENNMKLTVHEMIFQMHLEKQSYDRAVDEIKNVFNLMRVQLQKIQDACSKIRRNALNYSVRDYETILLENLDTIQDTKQKFQNYRKMVKSRARELEDRNINVQQLLPKEEEKLNHLREIESYLNRTIDEHQKILSSHFDLKALYTRELEQLSQMSLIRRFPLRSGLYDKVLKDADTLTRLDYFLRPLFNQDMEKTYNLNKAFQLQRPVRRRAEADSEEELDFDEESWRQEKEQHRQEKLKKYEGSLGCLIRHASGKDGISLLELSSQMGETERAELIPDVDIFKEVMVELIKNREIDLTVLTKERSEYIQDSTEDFQLNDMLLKLADAEAEAGNKRIRRIHISRIEDGSTAVFSGIPDGEGKKREIRCSNVRLRVFREE